METTKQILSDDQLNDAWGNANYGGMDKRDVVGLALLKYACGDGTGFVIESICRELKLITKQCNLTTLGKRYLFAHYSKGQSV